MSIKNNFYHHDKDKYEELLKVSNPKKVVENAIKYLNDPDIVLYISTHKIRSICYMIKRKLTKYILDTFHIPILLNIIILKGEKPI